MEQPTVRRLEQLRVIVTLAEWHLRTSTPGNVDELDAEEALEGAVWDLADSLVRAVLETLGDLAILMPDDARWELVDLAWAVADPRLVSRCRPSCTGEVGVPGDSGDHLSSEQDDEATTAQEEGPR